MVADAPGALIELCGVSLLERLRRVARQIGFAEATVFSNSADAIRQHLAGQSWRKQEVMLTVMASPGPQTSARDILTSFPPSQPAPHRVLLVRADFYYDERLLRALAEAKTDSVMADSNPPPEMASLWEKSGSYSFGRLAGAALVSSEWLSREGQSGDLMTAIATAAADGRLALIDAARQPGYIRSMRRDLRPLVFPAPSGEGLVLAERRLLDATQKGALDFPALIHAPIEKFLASRLCRTPLTPNQLTLATATLGLGVTALYATGHLGAGVLVALAVGVLDGVDGKLARLKVQTTKLGKGEHILDYFVELSWWTALASHFRVTGEVPSALALLFLLFASDIFDRLARALVEPRLRRSLDDIASFDRVVRYVGGRRNIYTWLFACFLLLGMPARGFTVFCWWGAATAAVHVLRALQIRFSRSFPR